MDAQKKVMFTHTRSMENWIPAMIKYKTEMKSKNAIGLIREDSIREVPSSLLKNLVHFPCVEDNIKQVAKRFQFKVEVRIAGKNICKDCDVCELKLFQINVEKVLCESKSHMYSLCTLDIALELL